MNQVKLGVLLSYFTIFIKNIIGLLFIPFMLRILGPSEYGLYSLVGSFAAYLGIIDMGFSSTTVRYLSKFKVLGEKESEARFLGMITGIYAILALIVLIVGYVIHQKMPLMFSESLSISEIHEVQDMFVLLIINISVTVLCNSLTSICTAYERFGFLRSLDLLKHTSRVIIILILLFLGYKAYAIVLVDTIINIGLIVIRGRYVFKRIDVKIIFGGIEKKLLKEVSIFSLFILINVLVNQIYWRLDNILLGVLTDSKTIGIYDVGSQLNLFYIGFSGAIASVFMPRIVDLVEKNASSEILTDLLIKTGRIQLLVLGLIFSGFLFFGDTFILLWAGQEYEMSFWVTVIVMAPLTIHLIQNIGNYVLEAKFKHQYRAIILLVVSLLNIIISVILIKKYGLIGAAVGTSFSFLFGEVILVNIYYQKRIGLNMVRFYKSTFNRIGLAFILIIPFGVIINYLGVVSWGILFIQLLGYSIVYTIIMWYVGMNEYEKNLANSIWESIRLRIMQR